MTGRGENDDTVERPRARSGVGEAGRSISHYRVLERLGSGGMGVVYKAQDTKLGRVVALKFLPPEWSHDRTAKERFFREARVTSAIDHPNICNIHEIDESEDGRVFIVMTYYRGKTLKHKIEGGPLSVDLAIDIALQVANGLAKAHAMSLVHRDIKPANIMITDDGIVKILDFGLVKLANAARITRRASTVGTVGYMSPEQTRGGELDGRADLWSLGVLLYEMLTGRLPFKGDHDQTTIYSIRNDEPTPPSKLNDKIPAKLESIIGKALSKDPSARYQSASEIMSELQSFRGDSPPSMRFAMDSTASRPVSRRRPGVIPFVALGAMMLGSLVLYRSGAWHYLLGGPGRGHPIESLVVLPLQNLSTGPEQEYFADGMTEELISKLAKIESVTVISSASAMRYKNVAKPVGEIAKELRVDAVVEGSVMRDGSRVRITARLTDAATDRYLWTESYARDVKDVIALQAEVAQAIAREIQVVLTPLERERLAEARPVSPEAYEAYLKGRYHWNQRTPEGLEKGFQYFEQATRIDPGYGLAYAGVADSYLMLGIYGVLPLHEAYPGAREAASRALEIDDGLAEAHTSLAAVRSDFDWDWAAAEKGYRRAIELNPSYATAHLWYSYLLGALGRPSEAIAQMKRAQEIDPLSLITNANAGWVYYVARQYDRAIEECHKTLELDEDATLAHYYLGQAYEQTGRLEEAIAEFEKARILSEGHRYDYLYAVAGLGHAYAVAGNEAAARKILAELEGRAETEVVKANHLATVYVGLGEKDKALRYLEEAYSEHSNDMPFIKVEPTWNSLRSEPQFIALLKKMGL